MILRPLSLLRYSTKQLINVMFSHLYWLFRIIPMMSKDVIMFPLFTSRYVQYVEVFGYGSVYSLVYTHEFPRPRTRAKLVTYGLIWYTLLRVLHQLASDHIPLHLCLRVHFHFRRQIRHWVGQVLLRARVAIVARRRRHRFPLLCY